MSDPAWIKCRVPRPDARLRLFCIAHAGGGASAFRMWADDLPATVEVCAVQLPGREERVMEEAFHDAVMAAEAVADVIGGDLDRPWALFGHSMGALVGFELLRVLRLRGARGPEHFFASGHRGPHLPIDYAPFHELPDDAFVAEMNLRYDSVPAAARESAELMELLLPGLRADIAVCDTYAFGEAEPLACAITAYGGEDDEQVPRAHLEAWSRHTGAIFDVQTFPGGHFYLRSAQRDLLADLVGRLSPAIS
jgi:medium-chain acyl-[acyl-carrier-protein] hydrolase